MYMDESNILENVLPFPRVMKEGNGVRGPAGNLLEMAGNLLEIVENLLEMVGNLLEMKGLRGNLAGKMGSSSTEEMGP